MELKVNGVVVRNKFSFPRTGTWTTWKSVSIGVDLKAGSNIVQLTAVGVGGPNIDRLDVRLA